MSATSTYMTFLMHKITDPTAVDDYTKKIQTQIDAIDDKTASEEQKAYKRILEQKKSEININKYFWDKLIDITEFPDIGTDPEMLETTTLSDDMQTFVVGIHGNESMNFNANYDHETYLWIKSFENQTRGYAVWFGGEKRPGNSIPEPTGTAGKFSFEGQLSVRVTGGGVNEVRGMGITIAPSSVICSE